MLDWWEKNFATCELGDKPDGMATLTASQQGTGKTDNLYCLY